MTGRRTPTYGPITEHTRTADWRVERTTLLVPPVGKYLDDERTVEDDGTRYRWACRLCRDHGAWRKDGNLADGDEHLYRKHGIGD